MVTAGWFHILKEKKDSIVDLGNTLCTLGATGNIELLEWLWNNLPSSRLDEWNKKQDTSFVWYAAMNNQVVSLEWANENLPNSKWQEGWVDKPFLNCPVAAARKGYLDVLMWLHKNRTEEWAYEVWMAAVGSEQLNVLHWLHGNRTEPCYDTNLNRAVETKNLKVLKFLQENRTEVNSDFAGQEAASTACVTGNLEMLKYIHEHWNIRLDEEMGRKALESDNVKLIQWMCENGPTGKSNAKLKLYILLG